MNHFNTKKINDEAKSKESLNMSDEEIIKQIFLESGTDYLNNTENVSKSVAYFAVLISRLSEKSDKLQKRMLCLNFLVAFLTIVLLLTIPQVNEFFIGTNKTTDTAKENPKAQTSNNEKSN